MLLQFRLDAGDVEDRHPIRYCEIHPNECKELVGKKVQIVANL